MKAFFLILFISMTCGFSGYSQTVSGIPISQLDTDYIHLVSSSISPGCSVRVRLDIGQKIGFLGYRKMLICDDRGKPILFNSFIQAMNLMSENGYEYVNYYTVKNENSTASDSIEYYYLMRKRY